MADSMCGPSNAFKGLANHIDRDRSLQQDRLQGASPGPSQGFRSADARHVAASDADFASFQNGNLPFDAPLANTGPQHMQPWQHPMAPHHTLAPFQPGPPQQTAQNNWAQQFQQLSLHQPASSMAHGHLMSPGPSAGFQAGPQMAPSGYHSMSQASRFGMPAFGAPPAMLGQSMYHAPAPANTYQAGFDQDIDDWIFESLAAQHAPDTAQAATETLARDLAEARLETKDVVTDGLAKENESVLSAQTTDVNMLASIGPEETMVEPEQQPHSKEEDPTQLARAAKEVLNAVSNNHTEKFKKSAFFELMDKIASGNKVLQNNEFVDAADASPTRPDSAFGSHITGLTTGPNPTSSPPARGGSPSSHDEPGGRQASA